MLATDGSLSASGRGPGRDRFERLRRGYEAAPLPVRLVIVVVCCVVGFPVALIFAPYAVISGRRSMWATGSVTVVCVALVSGYAHGNHVTDPASRHLLLLLPVATAFVAHAGARGRW